MRIDGQPVVQVDYQASTARLLFAKYGQVAPKGICSPSMGSTGTR